MNEWTEEDGTIYRLNSDGNYDVIAPKKSKAKPKKKATPKVKKNKVDNE